MTLDVTKLDVWYVAIPGQHPNGDWKPIPEYDAEKGPILYRAHVEYCGEGRDPRVWFSSYPIVRYTACGAWIGQGMQKDKFVNLRADRQWATVTKEQAMYHLTRRKSRQLQILNWKVQMCEEINQYLKTGAI